MNIFLVKTIDKNNMKKYLAVILEACPGFNNLRRLHLIVPQLECPGCPSRFCTDPVNKQPTRTRTEK